ncbi:acyltransferase family protein, partial [Streptomyces sp. MCAF7]
MDGLRGVTCLLVIVMHAAIVTGEVGVVGDGTLSPVLSRLKVVVPIFFVISGFLLYRPMAAAALDGRPRKRTGGYYWHRILRIMPAYWLVAAASLLTFERDRLDDAGRTVRILLLTHVYEYWRDVPHSIAPTWSLAT